MSAKNQTAPDSWESQASPVDSPTAAADVSTKFSTLNVNAEVFVPSFARAPPSAHEQGDSPPEIDECDQNETPVVNGKTQWQDTSDQ